MFISFQFIFQVTKSVQFLHRPDGCPMKKKPSSKLDSQAMHRERMNSTSTFEKLPSLSRTVVCGCLLSYGLSLPWAPMDWDSTNQRLFPIWVLRTFSFLIEGLVAYNWQWLTNIEKYHSNIATPQYPHVDSHSHLHRRVWSLGRQLPSPSPSLSIILPGSHPYLLRRPLLLP